MTQRHSVFNGNNRIWQKNPTMTTIETVTTKMIEWLASIIRWDIHSVIGVIYFEEKTKLLLPSVQFSKILTFQLASSKQHLFWRNLQKTFCWWTLKFFLHYIQSLPRTVTIAENVRNTSFFAKIKKKYISAGKKVPFACDQYDKKQKTRWQLWLTVTSFYHPKTERNLRYWQIYKLFISVNTHVSGNRAQQFLRGHIVFDFSDDDGETELNIIGLHLLTKNLSKEQFKLKCQGVICPT